MDHCSQLYAEKRVTPRKKILPFSALQRILTDTIKEKFRRHPRKPENKLAVSCKIETERNLHAKIPQKREKE